MRFCSNGAAPGPSVRPEMGGSGSPAPITNRPGAAGGGEPDDGVGSPGATGTAATLPDVCRPGIAKLRKSGFRNPRSARSGLDALGLEVLGLDVSSLDVSSLDTSGLDASSLDVSSFDSSGFERSGLDTRGLGKPLAVPDGSGCPPAPLGEPENSGLGRGVPALADPG